MKLTEKQHVQLLHSFQPGGYFLVLHGYFYRAFIVCSTSTCKKEDLVSLQYTYTSHS